MSLRDIAPWLEDTATFWEPAATIGSAVLSEPLAGLYGAGVGLASGDPSAGADAVRRAQEAMTYMPRTQQGQRGLRAVGETLSDAAETMRLDDAAALYTTASSEYLSPFASALMDSILQAGVGAPMRAGRSTIRGAQRKAFPGIYESPQNLLERAESIVPPESPALGRLWGVTRDDLRETAQRQGTQPGVLPGAAAKPIGSAAAEPVMKPANTGRLVGALEEARKSETLAPGMEGWYVMDPMYDRLLELTGNADEARRRYEKLNALSGMASPGSPVVTEVNRGTAAYYLDEQARFEDFKKIVAKPAAQRRSIFGEDVSEDLLDIQSHPYHSTAQARPMEDYLATGQLQMKSPKVPLYIQASGVPETGFQTDLPVGDAHWSRAVGLADTRTNKDFGASFSNPEAQALGPWWRENVAGQVGLESVPAQALAWGLYAPQTGVKTGVGVPKLEIWADEITKAADRLGVSPEEARDMILMGRAYAGGRLLGSE